MYIGKTPTVGAFQKCDAISVVNGQAAYTMQVGSANVSPESVNHMIVSLNGVIQSPTTAYTVSGATLTFASNLATGDVIDFILLLGNVLDIGTPSDNTVATAKIQDDAVTLAKMAAGTDGNIISYDASGNPVAIATGNDGQVLTSAGAGQPPAFEAASSGLSVADQWRITSNFTISGTSLANLTSNFERVDTGGQGVIGAMSESSGVFTFPSTGFYLVMADWSLSLDDNTAWINVAIQATTDNSSYAEVAQTNAYITRTNSVNTYTSSHINTLLDVTNTTNVKVKFAVGRESNAPVARGNTSYNYTYFTFLRLGDT